MTQAVLTIGIPAYNRREPLRAVLERLVADNVHLLPQVEVLVIDDDSPDNSYEAAMAFNGVGNIRVLKNAVRAGFRGNFCKLIEHSCTEYLMYSCDDDFVVAQGIPALLDYLASASPAPAMLSTLFYDKGQVYRSNTEQILPIQLGEYRHCCSHLPGLVYNARLAKAIVPRIERFMLDPRNAYPQCCLALLMLLFGYPGVYFPVELVRTGFDLESGIEGYATVAQRWQQYLFFTELLEHLAANIGEERVAGYARQLLEIHRQSLFLVLGNAVSTERPDLAGVFIAGATAWLEKQKAGG